jgi:hypothetical protein
LYQKNWPAFDPAQVQKHLLYLPIHSSFIASPASLSACSKMLLQRSPAGSAFFKIN